MKCMHTVVIDMLMLEMKYKLLGKQMPEKAGTNTLCSPSHIALGSREEKSGAHPPSL